MHRKSASISNKGKLGLDPKVAAGLAIVFLFFILSTVVAVYTLQHLKTSNERVARTHSVIVAIDRLLVDVQDAETGQRGFLLTGDERYLEPYNRAVAQIHKRMQRVEALLARNEVQDWRFEELEGYITTRFQELELILGIYLREGQAAAIANANLERGKAEMDAIRDAIGQLREQESQLRAQRVEAMKKAYTVAFITSALSGTLGIALTILIAALIRRATLARRREQWLQAAQVGLGSVVMGEQSTHELGQNILGYLTNHLGAVAGTLYMKENGRYALLASRGVPADVTIPRDFDGKDGLFAHVLEDHRPVTVGELPEGYIAFGSSLGQQSPRFLALAPALQDGEVKAVLELGFLNPVGDHILSLLEHCSNTIAASIRSAEFRTQLRTLLSETQRQAEEMQVQSEELRVSNEELEEQGRALKESQSRLEQQQVELEQTNSQLEEQAQELECQRDELEKANTAIQLKAREVEQASRYKSDFLANMSHELRTPLNSSLILAKLLADNLEDNLTPEQVKYAQTIQSSGNDLLNLINDILDLSKIEAGHVEIRPESVSLERMVNSLRHLFDPVARDKGLAFSVHVSSDVPPVIETDPQRLEQVLKNLIANAIKFTDAGSVTLGLRALGDKQISLSVTDTGIGIAEEQQARIFEAFHQADSTISRKFGGTGLGLSISREVVRLLGGTIHLKSRPGSGSTFTVVIPEQYDGAAVRSTVLEVQTAPPPPSVSPRPAPAPSRSQEPTAVDDDRLQPDDTARRLLIVEDDRSFAMILRDLARESNFQALVAETAQEALELARQCLPSAIVLDVGLPDQSGLSVLDRLKRDVRTRHIPIHIISAEDYSERALSMGAIGYALKPVQRDQLVDVLRSLEAKVSQNLRRVLIVEDNEVQREAVSNLIGSHDVETVGAGTAAECLALLKEQTFDCMVLDLSLPDASGFELLERISGDAAHSFPPVIVYTGRVLTREEEQMLRGYSKSIIIKGAKSPERLLDEVTLFLHQVVSELPDEQQKMIRKARNRDALLEGRRILIVEDDVRNIYALTNILEPRGAIIEIARNGEEALQKLEQSRSEPDSRIDLVLMDVMMPVMDGLTATRHIRKDPNWKKLPVIALTAKAMPDDQRRCIEAGANDYMAKPLDVEKLLSLVRVWMPQ
ncbi:Signal transduction histidine kinase [Halopseudomonas xinjiangensis]|uniref:histidine kinase n=1 Tax=Halopseudomonas xinjiangensis TaxID=487184 RepID=A0A1H1UN19_9GAMM|nr:response regulator [Halopseudomonas xinjiangensis]SDS73875.1 Signal transduction histidine kinase [Halopseudomonas xinjiangensis]